jgi:HAD superfamily hydrolase (TIGR01509 family)
MPAAEDEIMEKVSPVTCLFVDIGGVLLTDGWGRDARKLATEHFKLDSAELEDRHLITWNTYQEGKYTLDEYLYRVIFYKERRFSRAEFQHFMFAQSKPYPEMSELIAGLKVRHGLKIVVVSNEGRELNAHRIGTFKLNEIADVFISSCFVHLRKPDMDIFRLALDVAQVSPPQVLYIENTAMFVEIAEGLGIRGIVHTDYESTCRKLASLGLESDRGGANDVG